MLNKSVKMKLSTSGYVRFKSQMKKMHFSNEDLFLKYCVLKAIRPSLNAKDKKATDKELAIISDLCKKK